jgi:hypothetical protein
VTRLVAGEATELLVTKVDRGLIHCGTLTFEQKLGLEVDPVLGPDMWGAIRSQLRPELRTSRRRAVHLPAPSKRLLQAILLTAYVTTLAGMAVATGFGRYLLAVELGTAVVLLGVTMRVVAQDWRTLGHQHLRLRSGGKVWATRVSRK